MPPSEAMPLASEITAPPSMEIFLSCPAARNANHLPSGENTGFTAPSDPAMATGEAPLKSRRYKREPSEVLALSTMRVPSREIATLRQLELSEVPGGGFTVKRITGDSCFAPRCSKLAATK